MLSPASSFLKLTYTCFISALCILCCSSAIAQKKDTSNVLMVNILHNDNFIYQQSDSGGIDKLIGNVILQQGTDTMYSDSTYLDVKTNNLEAFGDIKIIQPNGTEVQSDYLRYTSNKKLAFLKGNVSLTDGKNKLWCEELTYDVGTKTGVYDKGGTLQSDSTTVSSNAGTYNVKTKDAHFTGDVIVTDPQYHVVSEDMEYNTESKVVKFHAPSIVTSDKSVLHTSCGTYDSKNQIANFPCHSSVQDDDQYLEGDTLYYNKLKSYGHATGHVVSLDTTHHSQMYCGHAEYYPKKRVLWATIKPVLVQVNGNDTLYIRADTFYSAPVSKAKLKSQKLKAIADSIAASTKIKAKAAVDTSGVAIVASSIDTAKKKIVPDTVAITTSDINKEATKKKDGKAKKRKGRDVEIDSMNIAAADTTEVDSTAPRYFIGYHHVKIYSDSLQGKCDSVSYTQSDSTIRMIYDPIAWSHNSQITGDTILLRIDSGRLKSLYVPNNALIVSRSGPVKANLFDQVQGKTLTGYFKDNTITKMVVFPNAESIYYPRNDKDGSYLGVDQSKSQSMYIYFEDQKIKRISLYQEPHETITPLDQVDLSTMKLSRFKWLIDKRPKNKEELFE